MDPLEMLNELRQQIDYQAAQARNQQAYSLHSGSSPADLMHNAARGITEETLKCVSSAINTVYWNYRSQPTSTNNR